MGSKSVTIRACREVHTNETPFSWLPHKALKSNEEKAHLKLILLVAAFTQPLAVEVELWEARVDGDQVLPKL